MLVEILQVEEDWGPWRWEWEKPCREEGDY